MKLIDNLGKTLGAKKSNFKYECTFMWNVIIRALFTLLFVTGIGYVNWISFEDLLDPSQSLHPGLKVFMGLEFSIGFLVLLGFWIQLCSTSKGARRVSLSLVGLILAAVVTYLHLMVFDLDHLIIPVANLLNRPIYDSLEAPYFLAVLDVFLITVIIKLINQKFDLFNRLLAKYCTPINPEGL